MRTVQTFILRLLVDPTELGTLRGALQLLPDGKPQSFANEEHLAALLHWHVAALGAMAVEPVEPEDEEVFFQFPGFRRFPDHLRSTIKGYCSGAGHFPLILRPSGFLQPLLHTQTQAPGTYG